MGKKGGQGPRAFAPRWVVTQPPCSPPLGPLAPGRPAQSLLPVAHTPMPHRPGPRSGLPPDLLLASRRLSEQTPPGCSSPSSPAQGRLGTQVSQALYQMSEPGRGRAPVTRSTGGEAEQLAQRLLFQETESSRVSSPRTLFPEGCIRLWEKAGGTPEPFPLESVIDSPPSSASSRPGPQVWWTLTLQGVFALMKCLASGKLGVLRGGWGVLLVTDRIGEAAWRICWLFWAAGRKQQLRRHAEVSAWCRRFRPVSRRRAWAAPPVLCLCSLLGPGRCGSWLD